MGVAEYIPRPDGALCVWWCRCPCAKAGPAPDRPARGRRRRKAESVLAPRPPATEARPDEDTAPEQESYTLF